MRIKHVYFTPPAPFLGPQKCDRCGAINPDSAYGYDLELAASLCVPCMQDLENLVDSDGWISPDDYNEFEDSLLMSRALDAIAAARTRLDLVAAVGVWYDLTTSAFDAPLSWSGRYTCVRTWVRNPIKALAITYLLG